MHHRLIDVPPSDISIVKPMVAHWIDEAAQSSSYFTSEVVWKAIEDKSAQLWLAWGNSPSAVCVTQLETTSKGKHCHIWVMVGLDMAAWHPLMNELEAWAKREGCNMMRHEARPGWSKILKQYGYKMPHVILEKNL